MTTIEKECDCNERDSMDDNVLCGFCNDDQETTPTEKECGHFWECGCDKEICQDCIEDIEEDIIMCDNEDCKMYYEYRNDNCDCNSCHYCDFRFRNK